MGQALSFRAATQRRDGVRPDTGPARTAGRTRRESDREAGATVSGRLQQPIGARAEKGRKLGHWGYTDTPFPFDGRQVVLPRPRLRTVDKRQEVSLPLVRQLQSLDPMNERVIEQILLGVSTRGYEQSLGPTTAGLRTKGARKSRVSEMLVAETGRRMKEQFTQTLAGLDLVAMMLDGIHVGGYAIVAALGIARAGTKHILGLRQGSTENKVLCTELLQDLVTRGLNNGENLLYVIDGGKGLRAAIRDVFGESAIVQRCQQHKRRNVLAHLPVSRQLTVWKLELPEALRRFFSSTNAIENTMGTVRRVSRNVKRWRHAAMAKRWTALGLSTAQSRFKRIKGHRQLPVLVEALARRAAKGVDQRGAVA